MRKMCRKYLFAAFVMGSIFPASALAQPASPPLWEMVRDLQQLRDGIAVGAPGALEKQAHMQAALGAQLRETDLSVFDDDRNIYALMTWLFGGGDADVAVDLLQKIPQGRVSKPLYDGALAYARGDRDAFLQALAKPEVETAAWPEDLRLFVWLAIATCQNDDDPHAASERLDYVRLAAPGSLFEGAAIRRQIRLAATLGDTEKIRRLIRDYTDRFLHSSYAADFWNEVALILPAVDLGMGDADMERLIALAPKPMQYLMRLGLARSALTDGQMERAFHYAEGADRLANALGVDDTTTRLYLAASRLGTSQAVQAAHDLETIRADRLADADRPLLVAARNVARDVVHYAEWLVADASPVKDNGNKAVPEAEVDDSSLVLQDKDSRFIGSPTEQKARDNSAEIDDFLKKVQGKLDSVDQLLKEEGE